MWVSTVRSDKNSRSAICRLVRSAAMSRAISSCLLVSSVPEASQVVGQGGQRQAGRQVMDAQGAEHRLRHQQRIADRVQQDQPGAAWETAGHLSGGPQGQLGLPGTAAAGQGQQAGGTQQPLDLAKLLPTPHEAGHLGRQVGQLTSHGSGLPRQRQRTPSRPVGEGSSWSVRDLGWGRPGSEERRRSGGDRLRKRLDLGHAGSHVVVEPAG